MRSKTLLCKMRDLCTCESWSRFQHALMTGNKEKRRRNSFVTIGILMHGYCSEVVSWIFDHDDLDGTMERRRPPQQQLASTSNNIIYDLDNRFNQFTRIVYGINLWTLASGECKLHARVLLLRVCNRCNAGNA